MTDTDIRVVSWSEIDTARQCPMKHQLAYKERWQQIETGSGNALSRGILWHEVMEAHYRFLRNAQAGGSKFDFTDEQITDYIERNGWIDWINSHPLGRDWYKQILELLVDPTGNQNEDQVLVDWMIQGYIRFYGFDQKWKILAVEHGVEYPLFLKGEPTRYRLKTKIDIIASQLVRGRAQRWMWDHKSGKDLPYQKDLDLADQFALYEHSLSMVGKPVFGTIHSAARTQRNLGDLEPRALAAVNKERAERVKKGKPAPLEPLEAQPLDARHRRTPMARTPIELECIAEEAVKTLDSVYAWGPGEAPRHPNEGTCSWRCSFTEPCLAGRKGLDMRDFLMRKGFQPNMERH